MMIATVVIIISTGDNIQRQISTRTVIYSFRERENYDNCERRPPDFDVQVRSMELYYTSKLTDFQNSQTNERGSHHTSVG